MKLATSIPPRDDGTVIYHVGGKAEDIVFDTEDGQLVAEVADPGVAKAMLKSGNYYPADEAAEGEALQLLGTVPKRVIAPVGGDSGEAGDGDDDGDDGHDDEGDDIVDPNAAPLEAGTPPKPAAELKQPVSAKAAAKAATKAAAKA